MILCSFRLHVFYLEVMAKCNETTQAMVRLRGGAGLLHEYNRARFSSPQNATFQSV
jgi:hypothetical protein